MLGYVHMFVIGSRLLLTEGALPLNNGKQRTRLVLTQIIVTNPRQVALSNLNSSRLVFVKIYTSMVD